MKKVFLKKCQEVPCGDKLVNELRDYTVKTYRFEKQDYVEYASPTKLVGEFSDKARRRKPANLFPFPKS